jgi:hypothetical protein
MGGKKKQTIGYKYFLGLHLVLCLGPIDRLLAMYADKKQAWAGDIEDETFDVDAEELFGGEEKEGGISGEFELQLGTQTQTVNPYLASKLAPELVPAYRGVSAVIAKQAYIGTQIYLKALSFLASRIKVRQNGIVQWYPEKAAIRLDSENIGTRVSVVVTTKTGAKASPDGKNWPYPTSSTLYFPIISILLAEDKKSFYALTQYRVLQSTDGRNWNEIANLTSAAPSGLTPDSLVFWKGYYWLVKNNGGVSRSLDCITWQHSSSGGYKIYVAGERLMAESSSFSRMRYIETPDGYTSWQSAGEKPSDSFNNGVWANGILKLASQKIVSASDRRCSIWSTVDGTSFTEDTLGFDNSTYPGQFRSIAYGNKRYVAVSDLGQIAVKIDGDIWRSRTDDFSFDTQQTYVKFFDGRFWLLRNDNSGGSFTTGYLFHSKTADNGSWVESLTGLQEDYNIEGGALIGVGAETGDMNPAHIIRECLTDPDWGLGYQESDIDEDSFANAADRLFDENFGMSLLWNRQTTVEDFIKEIVKHIDASVFVDRRTGKFKLSLIRDDFEVDDLITLNPSNIERISDFSRATFGELTNSITVKFWDKSILDDSSVTVQDIALSQMQGATINTTQVYSGITRKDLAARIAQRDLKTVSTPSASCTIYTNRIAADLEPGSPFKLNYPDLKCDNLVMRVTSIAYGDGVRNRIRLTCTQDVYNLPQTSIVTPEAPAWTDPSTAPVAAALRLPYEVPYLEAVQRQGQAAVDAAVTLDPSLGYVGVAAGKPSQASVNANLNVNSGGGFAYKDTLNFCPTATLVSDIGFLNTSFNVANTDSIADALDGTWFQINNEIMGKVSLVGTLLTVKRGCLDTVPAKHSTGDVLYFWDEFSGVDPTEYLEGESVDLKVTPITAGLGELKLLDAPTDTIEIVGRLAKPYPPGNLQINGAYFPENTNDVVGLVWAHRDRKLQTGSSLIGFSDSSIGPEIGTLYNARLRNVIDNSIITSQLNVNGNTAVLATDYVGPALIELESFRDSITSYQKYEIPISFINDTALVTESEELLIFEDSNAIVVDIFVPSAPIWFNRVEAAPVRTGNRQVAFFYWSSYPPGWSPDWDCTFSVLIQRRGLTVGAPSIWAIASRVTGVAANPLLPPDVDLGTASNGGVGAGDSDISLNELAFDNGIDLYCQQRTTGPFPSDWCDDFDSFGDSYQWAIAFPVGVPVNFRFNPGMPSDTKLGEIEFFGSSVSGTMGSTNPANARYYHDATVDFVCTLGSGFLDQVTVARSQVTWLRFAGPIVVGSEYKLSLNSVEFTYTAVLGDRNEEVVAALVALVEAHADYSAEAVLVPAATVGYDTFMQITGLPAISFTVLAEII